MTKELDLNMRRGGTFTLGVRWETEPWVYAAIASIALVAPVSVTTAAPHNIVDGWNVAVVDAKGLTQLNAKNNPPKFADMHRATVVAPDRIEFNELSAAAFTKHTAGSGYLAWLTPHALLGYTARMSIKDRVGGVVLYALNSAPGGGIVIDDLTKTIELTIPALALEGFAWDSAVYDLELVSPGGVVTPLLYGAVLVSAEITTP